MEPDGSRSARDNGSAALRGMMTKGMIRKTVGAIFNRQTMSDLVVFWFAAWILWWFRRWAGHGQAYFPDPTSPEARLYYGVEMRTLVRSMLQSFVIASLALLAWRMFRLRQMAAQRDSR